MCQLYNRCNRECNSNSVTGNPKPKIWKSAKCKSPHKQKGGKEKMKIIMQIDRRIICKILLQTIHTTFSCTNILNVCSPECWKNLSTHVINVLKTENLNALLLQLNKHQLGKQDQENKPQACTRPISNFILLFISWNEFPNQEWIRYIIYTQSNIANFFEKKNQTKISD